MKNTTRPEMDELEVLTQNLGALDDSRKQLMEFENRMAKLVQDTIEPMHEKIHAALADLAKETGFDWEMYLESFDVYDWQPGEFYEHIRDGLKSDLKDLLNRE